MKYIFVAFGLFACVPLCLGMIDAGMKWTRENGSNVLVSVVGARNHERLEGAVISQDLETKRMPSSNGVENLAEGNACLRRLVNLDYGMEAFPVWQEVDGEYILEADRVGLGGGSNIWSFARYCIDKPSARVKRYRVRFRVWKVAVEKSEKNAYCTGTIEFDRTDGLIDGRNVTVKESDGDFDTKVLRRSAKYVVQTDGSTFDVTYDGFGLVQYVHPIVYHSVKNLKDKGNIEWDDLIVEFSWGSVDVFAMWMLCPQDFRVVCL